MEAEKIFVPPDFYCPISGDLMIDPVSEPSGQTYEKSQNKQKTNHIFVAN